MSEFSIPGLPDGQKYQEFLNYLFNNGFSVIKKSDHELLLAEQERLHEKVSEVSQRYEDLRDVRYNAKIMEACNLIETLAGLIRLPMINYLDEFGKPVNNVSLFYKHELDDIRLLILHHVEALHQPKKE